ncbi:DNA repair and recombination protein RAD54B isoform X2 [Parasteatoda tepidariorum]|uniref:DNA repair and recombination protein RAD54B isoform X2 n=1 Tax=Parasteatoda tepidariorum TaxID=114398 RepID=UPI001C723DC5|nr:DNA repair and recombination protein RAD54B isoform X1 [Parasteatoda tepidariorum]
MRRSAAPSLQSSAKRFRFMSPFVDSSSEIKENDLLDDIDPEIAEDFKKLSSDEPKHEYDIPLVCEKNAESSNLRSTSEIMQMILGATKDCEESEKVVKTNSFPTTNVENREINNSRNLVPVIFPDNDFSQTNCSSATSESSVSKYNVLWCKRSGKKHKIWEGDGILIVRNRSAILKNSEGKEIDRGMGYKLKDISALEEGSKFYVGGKECEIQNLISSEVCLEEKQTETQSTLSLSHASHSPSLKKTKRLKSLQSHSSSVFFMSPTIIEKAENMPISESIYDLTMPPPTEEHQVLYNKHNLPLTKVKVDSFLVKCLRHHQKEGITFMYKCILGFQHDLGRGVILADEMGLGKTLQCIALIWTLFKQGPYGGRPVLKRVIIITPSSLVTNWKKEFHKWLGESRLSIFIIDKKHTVKEYVKFPKDILIISYEMFLRSAELLSSVSFDLVICDEGHRIKNLNIKISNVVNCLSTTKRILLTGTPIQNDLAEFFSIVDFVNPGAFGTFKNFRISFERPILQSRNQNCPPEEKEIGEEKSEELNEIIRTFMLRRTQEVINRFLPPKSEAVIFCRPSEFQTSLYKSLLGSRFIEGIFSSSGSVDSSLQLVYISMLRKLCNHPHLLYRGNSEEENMNIGCLQSVFPVNYQPTSSDSGKMKVLEKMLLALFSSHKKEKVVIVSAFTMTLNLIENLCKEKGYFILRLDGSTASASRQDIVDIFNRSYTKYNIFLLSSKAGGVGLNLIGASRIILYDVDWNPANDLQAMARIWRDGQKNFVYVYRLLTTGTIEEKIYQRQLSKQCLSGSVLNPNLMEKLKFSQEELKDLFSVHCDTMCLTHDLINCQCLNFSRERKTSDDNEITKIKKNKNIGMEELMNWHHICGPISQENTSDFLLAAGGTDITFVFKNEVNFSSHSITP